MRALTFAVAVLVGGVVAGALAETPEGGLPEIRAQITPKRFTTLSSEIPARIERMPVKEGDRFKQGDLLVAFDCSLQRAQADEARAAVTAAEKTRAVDKRLLDLGSGGALEADVAAAEAARAQARLQSASVLLSKCAITAPFSGRLVEQKVREHQYVQAGQSMLDILDDSVLEAEFIVPSRWLTRLKPGAPLQVQVDETGRTYPAKVVRLGARVDPVSHSVKITGELSGSNPELTAGMSGRVLISFPGE